MAQPPLAQPPLAAAAAIRSLTDDDAIYQAFDAYPWSKDKAFLSGLAAILGESNAQAQSPPGSPADITTHARIFYYAQRIGVHIDFASYHAWLARHPGRQSPQVAPPGPPSDAPSPSPPLLPWQQAAPQADLYVDRSASSPSLAAADAEPSYPMGFAEMLKLLQEGKPIPGIRQIPNTLARDPSVKPVGSRTAPKKPWEKDTPRPPPDLDLPRALDAEFPPLAADASESSPDTVPSPLEAPSERVHERP